MRITMVVLDILEAIDTADPAPSWGLQLCQDTGYGTGTVYPALDRLLAAGWIRDEWEDQAGLDRPARRYYRITEEGRACYRQAIAERAARIAARQAREVTV